MELLKVSKMQFLMKEVLTTTKLGINVNQNFLEVTHTDE